VPITKRIAGLNLLLVIFLVLPLAAQEEAAEGGDDASAAAGANNPLADITSFQFQNYYASDLYGMPNESSNTAWMRFVKPFGRVLLRASLPLSTVPSTSGDSISGIGDLNMFAAYLMTDPSAPQQYGIGPLVAVPTASDDALGVDAWQAGAAAVYFNLSSPDVQWGGLVTWQTDVSGDDNTNLAIAQPLLFIQMGKGAYLRSSGAWTFDMENDGYYIPVGFGIGKVVKSGRSVLNMWLEPQFTIAHDGAGYPSFQLFAAINLQLLGK